MSRRTDLPTRLRDAVSMLAVSLLALYCALGISRWYHRQQPAARWVSMVMRWNEPDGRWLGVAVHRVYSTQAACIQATPVSGLETLGKHTVMRRWYCERVWRVEP